MWLWDYEKTDLINLNKVSYYRIKKYKNPSKERHEYHVIAIMDNGDGVWLRAFYSENEARDFVERIVGRRRIKEVCP